VRGVLDDVRVIAVVRYRRAADLARTIDALDASGILVEITLDTPGAIDAIGAAAVKGLTVGAGTVIDREGVRESADAGASFVVSPGLVDDVVEAALAPSGSSLSGGSRPRRSCYALGLSGRAR
jgi:2-dehydro-3-deoxyphosphogluconate aldolase / (4S)-4-hydroxy-2-oxoglutarate aldolase